MGHIIMKDTFLLLTTSVLQARSTDYKAPFMSRRLAVIGDWCILILPLVLATSCSLSGPLVYRSPVVVFFDRGNPCFRNFNSIIPVDVIIHMWIAPMAIRVYH